VGILHTTLTSCFIVDIIVLFMQDERILRTLTSTQKSHKWSASSVEIIYGRLNCVRPYVEVNGEFLKTEKSRVVMNVKATFLRLSRDVVQWNEPLITAGFSEQQKLYLEIQDFNDVTLCEQVNFVADWLKFLIPSYIHVIDKFPLNKCSSHPNWT